MALGSFPTLWDAIVDRTDRRRHSVNWFADWTYDLGLACGASKPGSLRQYVMFIVIGTIAVFVLASFFWGRYVRAVRASDDSGMVSLATLDRINMSDAQLLT